MQWLQDKFSFLPQPHSCFIKWDIFMKDGACRIIIFQSLWWLPQSNYYGNENIFLIIFVEERGFVSDKIM